MFQSLISL